MLTPNSGNRYLKSFLFFVTVLTIAGLLGVSSAAQKTDKVRDRLVGHIETVFIEIAKIEEINGKRVEVDRIPWLSNTYDVKGRRIEERQLYKDKALNFKSVFTYRHDGLLEKGIEYDANGKIAFKWTYTHHLAENKVEEQRTRPDGSPFSRMIFQYDDQGNLVEEERFLPLSKNHFRWVYRFDEKGNRIEESFYLVREKKDRSSLDAASLNYRLVFSYDSEGNLVEEMRYDREDHFESKKTFRYKFDPNDNWISKTAWESADGTGKGDLHPTEVTHRTFTYY